MSEPTKLAIVRHGESRLNLEHRIQGQFDEDNGLTQAGVVQAQAIAPRLTRGAFAALYSSDLTRACQTAEAIANGTGHTILTDQRFRERHFGIFQRRTWAEIRARYPKELNQFRTSGPDYAIPDGESWRQCFDRVVCCLEEIARKHSGESVIVVTHVGPLEALFRHTLDIPFGKRRPFNPPSNVSLNIFFYEESNWILETWGDVAHLEGIGTLNDAERLPPNNGIRATS